MNRITCGVRDVTAVSMSSPCHIAFVMKGGIRDFPSSSGSWYSDAKKGSKSGDKVRIRGRGHLQDVWW